MCVCVCVCVCYFLDGVTSCTSTTVLIEYTAMITTVPVRMDSHSSVIN